jgi:hypothetical protein
MGSLSRRILVGILVPALAMGCSHTLRLGPQAPPERWQKARRCHDSGDGLSPTSRGFPTTSFKPTNLHWAAPKPGRSSSPFPRQQFGRRPDRNPQGTHVKSDTSDASWSLPKPSLSLYCLLR